MCDCSLLLLLLYMILVKVWYLFFSDDMRDSLENIPLFSDFSDDEGEGEQEQGTVSEQEPGTSKSTGKGTGGNPPVTK